MSIKLMSAVWNLDLPPGEKLVLVKMADHASDNGRNCFPSIASIARHTGFNRRTVQRHIHSLEAKGLLVKMADAPPKGAGVSYHLQVERGDTLPPLGATNTTQRGDKYDTEGRHSDAQTIIEPSFNPSDTYVSAPEKISETDIFRFGKSVLGKKAGGLITKLRQKFEYDDKAVWDTIAQAAGKQDPREWIGGVLAGQKTPDHILCPPGIYGGLQ